MSEFDQQFMRRAIELAEEGVTSNVGGPFGAIVVYQNKIIGEGCNRVTSSNDPTAHAEVVAIRQACTHLSHFQLHHKLGFYGNKRIEREYGESAT